MAEKIRTKVAEHGFHFENRRFGPITLSIGTAVFPNMADNADLLFKIADDALSEAKRNGRNKTVLAEMLPPSSPRTTELTT